MNIALDKKAPIYLAGRYSIWLIILGFYVMMRFSNANGKFGTGTSAAGSLHGAITDDRWLWLAAFVAAIAATAGLSVVLARSYQIEFRDNGLFLRYGVVNLNSELILFTKIQDVFISRNLAAQLLGLSTLTVQNAMGTSVVIPGLAADVADELRETILQNIGKAK